MEQSSTPQRYTLLHVHQPTFQVDPAAPVQYAGTVDARSPSEAFKLSQGGMNRHWKTRSTSVGDMIVTPSGELLLVDHIGFCAVNTPRSAPHAELAGH